MSIGLGIDTGGTYTDAVLLDMESGAVLAKAKALTTRENLAVGIGNSLRGFGAETLGRVSLVSLSSTLATNSIVEGKGCRVGLICIGREFDGSMSVDEYACISGSHDLSGREKVTLDTAALREALAHMEGKVDSVAVTGYMSVRNPEHEIAAAVAAAEILNVPAVCGHQLSSSLGFRERAVTAVMNARLIPVIDELIRSVREVMADRGIEAPLMIVRGNGSVMSEAMASKRPVETILSGPASSLTGAKTMTGLDDAIVVDMGGTTTDIGVLRGGFPGIEADGAMIGGHRTRVMAADISTTGIGGDSRIIVNGNRLQLTPLRVMPMCIAAAGRPALMTKLARLCEAPAQRQREAFDIRNVVLDYEFFIASKTVTDGSLSPDDMEFLELVRDIPCSLAEVAAATGKHPLTFNVDKMEERGLVQRIGLTPTDVLRAEGTYTEYDGKASSFAVRLAASKLGISDADLISAVKEMVVWKISDSVIRKLMQDETGASEGGKALEDTVSKFICGECGRDYGCSFKAEKPIVGIGAPADAWLPKVAAKLNTEYISPVDREVGNAVGAITGCILESIEILIEPGSAFHGGASPCTAFSKLGRFEFPTVESAIADSKLKGGEHVASAARIAGASEAELRYGVVRRNYTDNCGTEMLMDVRVTVTAVGKPQGFTCSSLSYSVTAGQ